MIVVKVFKEMNKIQGIGGIKGSVFEGQKPFQVALLMVDNEIKR